MGRLCDSKYLYTSIMPHIQMLNLTQHIEDGYQRGMFTGAAFDYLSGAYGTVNHIILILILQHNTGQSTI